MNKNKILVLLAIIACGAGSAVAKSSKAGGLPALSQQVADLQAQVDAMTYLEVSADCGADPAALQAAVDAAPAVGARINVSGACDAVLINGKSNVIVDGGGSASITGDASDDLLAALYIEASTNITIQGLSVFAGGDAHALSAWHSTMFSYSSSYADGTISSMDISRGTAAAMSNITALGTGFAALHVSQNASLTVDESFIIDGSGQNALAVETGGTLLQASGFLDVDGRIFAEYGGHIAILSGDINSPSEALEASRNSTIVLNSVDGITVAGDIRAFSSSNIDLRAGGGAISLSGNLILIQRNSSFFNPVNPDVDIDYAFLSARQNSVLDILVGNFVTTPAIQLILGSGMRSFVTLTATCDDSAWTFGTVTCSP